MPFVCWLTLQPVKMMEDFLRLASESTAKNLETCGVLAGSLVGFPFYCFLKQKMTTYFEPLTSVASNIVGLLICSRVECFVLLLSSYLSRSQLQTRYFTIMWTWWSHLQKREKKCSQSYDFLNYLDSWILLFINKKLIFLLVVLSA